MIDEILKRSIAEFALKQVVTKETVTQFLSDCRSLIEFQKTQDDFSTLYFYCNWSLHSNIDKNQYVYEFLGNISECFSGVNNYNIAPYFKLWPLTENILDIISITLPQIPFGVSDTFLTKLIFQIFHNLMHRTINFPLERNKSSQKKIEDIVKKASIVSEKVDKVDKHLNPKLVKTADYSKPVIVSSFKISAVENNSVFFELMIDKSTSDKEITVLTGFKLTITTKSANEINFKFEDVYFPQQKQ